MANTPVVIQNSSNPAVYDKPGLVGKWASPDIIRSLEAALDADTQSMHPTVEETMRFKIIQFDVQRNLSDARNSYDTREWMAEVFLLLVCVSMMMSVLGIVIGGFTVLKAVYMVSNVLLIGFDIMLICRCRAILKKLKWAVHMCSSLSTWTEMMCKSRKRLLDRGVILPASLQVIVPFLSQKADERILSANGARDTLAMIRLATMLDALSRDNTTSSIVFSGETEELLGRVGDTLGAFPSRVKPGEVML